MMNSVLLVASASIIFSVYLVTLSPSIAGGDSGELVAEGCTLGIAHPPGYPLFTILVYLLKICSTIGSVAFRVNLSSACFTTLSAYLIGEIIQMFPGRPHDINGSLFAMTMFSFSPLIWQYAVTAEVFPMNTFFTAVILYITMLFARKREFPLVLLGSFVCGLAACNQHTIVLFQIPLILWMIFLLRRYFYARPLTLIFTGIAYLLGLLPYIYLPISGNLNPQAGSWGNVKSLQGFLHHFFRRDYGTFKLFSGSGGRESEGFSLRTLAYIQDLYEEQGYYISVPLAVVGIVMTIVATLASRQEILSTETFSSKQSNNKRKLNEKAVINMIRSQTALVSKAVDESQKSYPSVLNCNDYVNKTETIFTATVLFITYVFYFLIFHSLSNLPLGDKLLYGIHQRFWMQPNVVFFIFAGVGFNYIMYTVYALLLGVYSLITTALLNDKKNKSAKFKQSISMAKSQQSDSNEMNKNNKTNTTERTNFDLLMNYTIQNKYFLRYLIGFILAVYLGRVQHDKNFYMSDQSEATSFKNYASAILNPLPINSVLLVNYDMLWTSIRYIQQCEGFRKDVIAINLSMMTYTWFEHKKGLLPRIEFPGAFHAPPTSPDVKTRRAFTLKNVLDANLGKMRFFIVGKLSFSDPELEQRYSLVPVGLSMEFKLSSNSGNATSYMKLNNYIWKKVDEVFKDLPSVFKYPEETWEWTLGRDYKDHMAESAAHLLELAIPTVASDPLPLLSSVYYLESTLYKEFVAINETAHLPTRQRIGVREEVVRPTPSTALLKNTGLAHVYLLKSKTIGRNEDGSESNFLPLPNHDVFKTYKSLKWPGKDNNEYPEPWIQWSANRFLYCWGEYLKREDAREDPQYDTIKATYDTMHGLFTKKR